MDPYLKYISGNSSSKKFDKEFFPVPYENKQVNMLPNISNEIYGNTRPLYNKEYVDYTKYKNLVEKKRLFSSVDFQTFVKYRAAVNPFENLGRSIFIDRASIKLANLDALFDFMNLRSTFGVYVKDNNREDLYTQSRSFADVAGGPGGFTQYILYRDPHAIGWGVTLDTGKKETRWNDFVNKISNFKPFYNDIIADYDKIMNSTDYKNNVDIVVADGGLEINPEFQEQDSTILLIAEVLIGIDKIAKGNSSAFFILKLFDTVTKPMSDLIYLISLCFDKVYLIKPLSSRPANSEKYLVANGSIKDGRQITVVKNVLIKIIKEYNPSKHIISLIDVNKPNEFNDWLKDMNNIFLENQTKYVNKILKSIAGQEIENEKYNLFEIECLFRLPGNTFNNKITKPN